MIFLPIVVRELRVAARRKSTYSVRFGSALAAVMGGTVMLFILSRAPLVPGIGWAVFLGLAAVSFFHCLTLAANTADCISEEKREGTLGLLFLTDLNGWDVTLGKLCANSLKSFYAVLGTFPVVAIVLTLGGVSAGQFCKVALALLNVFFFAHAAGLLASVLTRGISWAHGITALLLFGFLAGPPLLALAVTPHIPVTQLTLLLAAFSPGYALVEMMLPAGIGGFYWFSLLMVHLMAWLFLALASWRLPYCWQEKAGPVRLRWRERFRQWTYGSPVVRRDLRRQLVGINPFLWLVSRDQLTPAIFKCAQFVAAGLTIWGWIATDAGERRGLCSFVVIVAHLTLICGVAAESSRHLDEHRRSGALEFVLCSTSLSPAQIMAGQWLALRRQFQRPLIAVVAADLLMVVLNHTRCMDSGGREDIFTFDCFMAVAIVMLVVDMFATGWVGMWRAMANKRPKQNVAVVETGFLLVMLPFMLMGLVIGLLALIAYFVPVFDHWLDSWSDSVSFLCGLGLWFILALAVAAGCSFLARRQLRARFREMAVVQGGEPLGILAQLGRLLGRVFRRNPRRTAT